MTAILVSRFLLQLQEVKKRTEGESSLGDISSLKFDRVVGCLSAELQAEDVWAGSEVPGEEPRGGDPSNQEIELTDRVLSMPVHGLGDSH